MSLSKGNFKEVTQGKKIEREWKRILENAAIAVTDILKTIFQERLIISRIPIKAPCLI